MLEVSGLSPLSKHATLKLPLYVGNGKDRYIIHGRSLR
jgi:hypothetical protein